MSNNRENAQRTIVNWAKSGGRVAANGKNIWLGLGNCSGLHSFADTLLREKWEKSGERFEKKLDSMPSGVSVVLLDFVNVNRDRGNWLVARTVTLP